MSCFLCGHEEENRHHLGCARIARPDLTVKVAQAEGLIATPKAKEEAPEPKVEVLKPGSMTTVPEDDGDEPPAKGGETVEACDFEGCDNPKYSSSPRAKWCDEHKDPKSRKE